MLLIHSEYFSASILVDELWGHRKNYDVPVAKVYGQLVTDSDIRSLHGTQWLTDKVNIPVIMNKNFIIQKVLENICTILLSFKFHI